MEPTEEKSHYQLSDLRHSRGSVIHESMFRSAADELDQSLGALLDAANARLRFMIDATEAQLDTISHLDSLASFAGSQISQVQSDIESLSGSVIQMQHSQQSDSSYNSSYDTSYSPGVPLGTLRPSSDMARLRPSMYAPGPDNVFNYDSDGLITDADSSHAIHGADDSLDTGDSVEDSVLQQSNGVDADSFEVISNDLNMQFVNMQRGDYQSERNNISLLHEDLDFAPASSEYGSVMQTSDPSVIGSADNDPFSYQSPMISVSESDSWSDTELVVRQAIGAAIGIPMTGTERAIMPIVRDYWDSLDIADIVEIAQNCEEEPDEFEEYINI